MTDTIPVIAPDGTTRNVSLQTLCERPWIADLVEHFGAPAFLRLGAPESYQPATVTYDQAIRDRRNR